MRALADATRIQQFMKALGREADQPAQVYLTGGATAVLYGWRESTIDVDIKMVPDLDRVFRAIPEIKERLQINVELASPDDFIPVRDGWQDRSPFIAREGQLTFRHYDLYAQALAKIERAHAQDEGDVRELLDRGLVEPARLLEYFSAIEPRLYRFPAVDPGAFRRAVMRAVGGQDPKSGRV
jgi:non-ribosomal peptide synthetase component F